MKKAENLKAGRGKLENGQKVPNIYVSGIKEGAGSG